MLDRRHWMRSVLGAAGLAVFSECAFAKGNNSRTSAGRGWSRKKKEEHRVHLRYLYYREPRLLLLNDSEDLHGALSRLKRSGGEFEVLEQRGWLIGTRQNQHLQLVEADHRPDLVQRFEASDYPWVGCLHRGRIVRVYHHGSPAPLDAWTFTWLLTGQNNRPKKDAPRELTVDSAGRYPLHGGHWIINGDHRPVLESIVAHLRVGRHAQQIPKSWDIENWSYDELRCLHDDLHRYGRPRKVDA